MSIPTESPGSCIAIRHAQTDFLPSATRPASLEASVTSASMNKADLGALNEFGEQFRSAGIDISREELHELRVFDEFLAYHVQPNGICDVQCTLLWNEWVRTFRRQVHAFPKLILEKEFRSVILDKFGTDVAHDDFRGAIYNGIRFVP